MNTREILTWLEKTGAKATRDAMARYGIVARKACGVPMGALLRKSKEIGKDHALALALWDTGCYEARLLATLIGEPEKLTRARMNAWAKGFENWADGDTACFKLFDRSPLAWEMIRPWAKSPREMTRRGGYALLASLALHDKKAADDRFLAFLPLIEEGAKDERNFVKKGVNWALRGIGRRNPVLLAAASETATRLSASPAPAPRWVGRDALREFARLAGKKKSAVRLKPAGSSTRR